MTASVWLVLPGVILWAVILALPWQPWRNRETLQADSGGGNADLSGVTVLVPARNEAGVIAGTLRSLASQGRGLGIVLVNDRSEDATVAEAERLKLKNLTIVNGRALEPGWSGKLWALHQGLPFVQTETILLLDADIRLEPGTIAALKARMQEHDLHLVSLLAFMRVESFWEKLLMPAFVYFFKLLYPFHLSNSGSGAVAAAAGGCVLLRTDSLARAGGFEAIKDKLIDDCALARRFRNAGLATWIGLSHSAQSQRSHDALAGIWNTIARTAYTQLRHSFILLALCTALLTAGFVLPPAGLFSADPSVRLTALAGILLMAAGYLPTLRYYGLNPAWCAAFPLAGALYLLMTWSSAWRHWTGAGAGWKQRSYTGETGNFRGQN
ncbi:MAG: glycosyltransferase [Gammaproteobacteria bacterium]|nr:glycosyltransferase [Gammaproteobacteria bacterium]